MMKYSLILGTVNRPESLTICLNSISKQYYKNYEVLLVDQGNNPQTKEIAELYENRMRGKLIYIHSEKRGLSLARNLALKKATGDYFCLIDDDAYYDENYLQTVESQCRLRENKYIYSGYIYNTLISGNYAPYKHNKSGNVLTIREAVYTCPSASLAIPMDTYNEIGGFDEMFGVGAEFKSCEETEFLLRALDKKYKIIYLENMCVKHPVPKENFRESIKINSGIYEYFRALGAAFEKNRGLDIGRRISYLRTDAYMRRFIKLSLPFKFNREGALAEYKGLRQGEIDYKKVMELQ